MTHDISPDGRFACTWKPPRSDVMLLVFVS